MFTEHSLAEVPISFRPDAEQRKLIASLAKTDNMSPTDVVKRGLELMRAVHALERPPIYARSVDDADVDVAVEEAVSAACERLGDLFREHGAPEVRGISSNFQGLLADHIRAMLCGFEHANKRYATPLIPLLARWDSFGRHVYSKADKQGVTLMRPAQKVGDEDLFFGERGMVPLSILEPGELYTSSEAAVKGYLAYLDRRGESPQEHPARLVVLDFTNEALVALEA